MLMTTTMTMMISMTGDGRWCLGQFVMIKTGWLAVQPTTAANCTLEDTPENIYRLPFCFVLFRIALLVSFYTSR